MTEPTYEVEEHTTLRKTTGPNITQLKLIPQFDVEELSDDEKDLWLEVKLNGEVPEDAEEGDIYTAQEIVGEDAEDDQSPVEKAVETGEEVVVDRTTEPCNDDEKECSLDRITRVATPDGETETRRTHTY